MVLIAKRFETYVSLKYLGLSPKKLPFSVGNNHVPTKKRLKLFQGTIKKKIFSKSNNVLGEKGLKLH
jgi:hypothetical protein